MSDVLTYTETFSPEQAMLSNLLVKWLHLLDLGIDETEYKGSELNKLLKSKSFKDDKEYTILPMSGIDSDTIKIQENESGDIGLLDLSIAYSAFKQ